MFPLTDEGYYCADMDSHYVETWAAMEKLVDEKLTRTIGLSNFNRFVLELTDGAVLTDDVLGSRLRRS